MKKFFALIALVALFGSCDIDDDANFHFELLPVESATLPESFELNQTYQITVTFNRPTTCHFFNDFSYTRNSQTERTVAIIATVVNDDSCSDVVDEAPREVTFDFMALYQGTYTFNFWTGQNADGVDEFFTIEVPVVN